MKKIIIWGSLGLIWQLADAEVSNNEAPVVVINSVATNQAAINSSSKIKSNGQARPRTNRPSPRRRPNVQLDQMHFDFTYSGDIQGALKQLQEYDYSLQILPALGRVQATNLTLDLANTNLEQLLAVINGQLDGYASLQFDPQRHSLRVIYVSKMRELGYDALQEAKRWREGHKPKPIVSEDGVLEYPYGFYQPVIPCKIGMICDIRLGAGESLIDWAISDRGNWQMYSKGGGGLDNDVPSLAFSGSGANLIPHVLIKPTPAATTTNLVILTNQRTYDLLLKATNSDYVLAAGFYFPNLLIKGLEDSKEQQRNRLNQFASEHDLNRESATNFDLAQLNTDNYTISGDDVGWKPTAVFDDGERVWIKFNNTNQIAPALLEVNEDDDDQPFKLLRYFPQPGNFYVVSKVFDKAVLVMGINDQSKKVYITRKKAETSWWHKVFG